MIVVVDAEIFSVFEACDDFVSDELVDKSDVDFDDDAGNRTSFVIGVDEDNNNIGFVVEDVASTPTDGVDVDVDVDVVGNVDVDVDVDVDVVDDVDVDVVGNVDVVVVVVVVVVGSGKQFPVLS